jgi:hypothetical protein
VSTYTPSFTQANLTALEQAIALGVLRVRYQDREVIYQSRADMMKTLSFMLKAMGKTSGALKTSFTCFKKGL